MLMDRRPDRIWKERTYHGDLTSETKARNFRPWLMDGALVRGSEENWGCGEGLTEVDLLAVDFVCAVAFLLSAGRGAVSWRDATVSVERTHRARRAANESVSGGQRARDDATATYGQRTRRSVCRSREQPWGRWS